MQGRFPFVFMSPVLGEDIEETEVPRGEPGWLLLASLNLAPKPLLRGVLAGATLPVNKTEKYERDNYSQSNLFVITTVPGPLPINTMCSDSRNIWRLDPLVFISVIEKNVDESARLYFQMSLQNFTAD